MLELKIQKKSFEKDGEKLEYYELSTVIDNQKISLQVKEDDKKLFKYLAKFHKYDDKGVMVE